MVSEFKKQKYLHVFHKYLDTDKSGVIDKNDFRLAAENFAAARGLTPGDAIYESLKESMFKIWAGMLEQGDSDGNGQITADEWVQMWDNFGTKPSEWQNLYCKVVFKVTDYDSNGFIDEDDMVKMCAAMDVPKNIAAQGYKNLAQGKGKISEADFEKLWKEYFVSDDKNATGNHLFGFHE